MVIDEQAKFDQHPRKRQAEQRDPEHVKPPMGA
jgi:hypothetical protein